MPDLLPPYPLISNALREGKVIPFLGAGASHVDRPEGVNWQDGFLPLGRELCDYLARQSNFPEEDHGDLAKVAQYHEIVAGRGHLDGQLRKIFNQNYELPDLHRYLAQTASEAAKSSNCLLIVTTNYDDLLERAFVATDVPFDLVVHTTNAKLGDRLVWKPHDVDEISVVAPNKLDIPMEQVHVIYKMHGTVDRADPEGDQFVITEDDYINFLSRMTRKKAVPAIFAEPFQSRHFLFLGYGLQDWNLRVVLNRIECDLGRTKDIKSWAIQYDPSPLEQRFWERRGVEVFHQDLSNFVQQLALAQES